MAKKSYIPLVSEVTIRYSKIHVCKYQGKECLLHFIKTRYHQPDKCLNCLKELGVREDYRKLKVGNHTIKTILVHDIML